MADVLVDSGSLQDIADAIRQRGNFGNQYKPSDMADAILNIPHDKISLQQKTVSPTTHSNAVYPDSDFDGLRCVIVNPISPIRTGDDITLSSDAITVPYGYYQQDTQKSVASGSVSVSATKGAVSNHSITVTPSAITEAGYIAGGSTSGTAVSVSASELVSGTKTVTSNGTTDVSNYANVEVAIPTYDGQVVTS